MASGMLPLTPAFTAEVDAIRDQLRSLFKRVDSIFATIKEASGTNDNNNYAMFDAEMIKNNFDDFLVDDPYDSPGGGGTMSRRNSISAVRKSPNTIRRKSITVHTTHTTNKTNSNSTLHHAKKQSPTIVVENKDKETSKQGSRTSTTTSKQNINNHSNNNTTNSTIPSFGLVITESDQHGHNNDSLSSNTNSQDIHSSISTTSESHPNEESTSTSASNTAIIIPPPPIQKIHPSSPNLSKNRLPSLQTSLSSSNINSKSSNETTSSATPQSVRSDILMTQPQHHQQTSLFVKGKSRSNININKSNTALVSIPAEDESTDGESHNKNQPETFDEFMNRYISTNRNNSKDENNSYDHTTTKNEHLSTDGNDPSSVRKSVRKSRNNTSSTGDAPVMSKEMSLAMMFDVETAEKMKKKLEERNSLVNRSQSAKESNNSSQTNTSTLPQTNTLTSTKPQSLLSADPLPPSTSIQVDDDHADLDLPTPRGGLASRRLSIASVGDMIKRRFSVSSMSAMGMNPERRDTYDSSGSVDTVENNDENNNSNNNSNNNDNNNHLNVGMTIGFPVSQSARNSLLELQPQHHLLHQHTQSNQNVRKKGIKTIMRTNLFEEKYTLEGSTHSLEQGAMTGTFVNQFVLQKEAKARRHSTQIYGRFTNRKAFKGFHPRSAVIVRWEFLMSCFYILIIIVIPFLIAFEGAGIAITISSIITTIIYFIDMLILFCTLRYKPKEKKTLFKIPYLSTLFSSRKVTPAEDEAIQNTKANQGPSLNNASKEIILDLKTSRSQYIYKNLALDMIGMLPWDLILASVFSYSYLLLFVKFIRIGYLPSLTSKSPYYKSMRRSMEEFFGIGQAFSAVFALAGSLLAWFHIQACAIFLLAKLTGFTYSPIINTTKLNEGVFDQYTWCFFQAISNTFPVQYKPLDTLEIWAIIIFVVTGALIYASILGIISSFSFGLDASGRMYKQKMDEVNEYMEWKRIPEDIRKKVRHYYALKYRGKFFEEGTLLQELNESLRQEISMHNCRELISKVPFLNRQQNDGRDEWFFGRIATSLVARYYVKGDIICSEGEPGQDMFFILQGYVFVFVNQVQVATLKEGQYFGEVAMIAQIPRTATIAAGSSCILYKLSRADFLPIIREFEDVKEEVAKLFAERMAKVFSQDQQLDEEQYSDDDIENN